MEFRILGPLEVLVDGRQASLGGPRQRGVLAVLLLHRGDAVSVDRIVDALWGERPPDTATKTVQVYVSRLRKALGDGALVTRGGGYALQVGGDAVDADRFERLIGEGRRALDGGDPRRAAERLSAALDLWRGPPLSDFAYEAFAQTEIARLEELHLDALEHRIEADLALGRHAALVHELETLVAEHPARERLRGMLMLALYRSGRQSQALESYRDARRTLDEELGLEPGPELRRLEQAILAQDPAIEAPPRRGPLADLRRRGRGGFLIAFGGGLLLAAVVAAIIASSGDEGSQSAGANSLAVIDPEADRVIATVPTGVQPTDVSADADSVWVGNRQDDSVTQIDPETQVVVSTTSAGTSVGGLAAGAGAVWIGDARGEKLVRLDPAFRSRLSIRLARRPDVLETPGPNPLAVGAEAIWVGKAPGGVARIDPGSDTVVATVPVGNSPSAIAVGLGGVWVADDVDNTVTRIDAASANAVTATTAVGQGPTAVAVGEDAVWVANTQDNTVSRVDPDTVTVIETIAVGSRPTGVAVGAGAVWVANSLDGTVSRIDPEANQVVSTVEVGEAPHGITVAHDRVWATVQVSAIPPETPTIAADGEVARLVVAEDPGPLDPAMSNFDDYSRLGATCALLYNYPDRPFPVGARLQPEVAAGPPSVSDDGRTYTFTLRPGFRFSPPSSDEPVTAAAFERAIERALDPTMASYAGALANDIVGAKDYAAGRADHVAGVIADGATLSVELERPAGNLIERLSTPWFCAVPPDAPVDRDGVDLLPSAGPYYVASYVPDRSIVLRRNPNYAGQRPQELEEIRYEISDSVEHAIEQVEAGEGDHVALDPAVEPSPPDVLRRLTAEYGPRSEAARAGRQQVFTQPSPLLHYFIFNNQRGRFQSVRLRQAVNYAMDRPALAANAGFGQGRPTDQYIPPGMPGFEDATIYPLAGPDLATARRLAGEERRRAVLYTCNLPDCTRHAEILRSNLGAIGIELDVRQFPLEQFFTRIQTPGEPWDLAYWNWVFDYADPATFINDQFATATQLPTVVEDPRMQRRMEAAALLTGDARLRAYARLDRDLAEQAVAAPFASGTVTHFFSARMGCQVLHPVYGLDLPALCVRDDAEAD